MSKEENIFNVKLSEYSQPVVKESYSNDWVEITVPKPDGGKQRYFDYLIDRYRNSTTNNAILNNIIKLIYGKGLTARDSSLKPNDFARFKMMFANKDVKNVITDFAILGTGAFQVLIEKGDIKSALHIPRNLLTPEKCDDDGNINNYYYSDDWSNVREYPPRAIPVLKSDTKANGVYLVVFGDYAIGKKYLFNVDYEGGLDYAQLEEYIANYQINDCLNGFSPTMFVNFNNGLTDEKKQKAVVEKIEHKLTGVTGKKLVVSFNPNKDAESTITPVPINDAPAHYEYLSNECRDKLLAAHNVVSRMLVGIANDANGFSSTADEIEIATQVFHNQTINTKQETIIDAIDFINAKAGITLDLRFERNVLVDIPEAPKVAMSSQDADVFNEFDAISSELGDDWELIDSSPVDYDTEESEDEYIKSLNTPKLSAYAKLKAIINTGTARPNAKSAQDNDMFKSRYRYTGDLSANSREFCVKMVNANKIYRKEDIMKMSETVVNQGWGPEGADKYDIWLYKGGGDCGHYWVRETYLRKSDVNNPNAQTYTPAQQRKAGYIAPRNESKVYEKPRNMANRGFLKPKR